MNKLTKIGVVASSTLLLAACMGSGSKDELRTPVSQTGISVGLQVNLAKGASEANAVASIYKDGERQPLVGGDFFMARSTAAPQGAVLKSIENLSGDYLGNLPVIDRTDIVTLSTEYDPERAREDRWYPVDELMVDPGPNADLMGYTAEVAFPEVLEITSGDDAVYNSQDDNIVLTWTPGNGQQMNTNALVTCVDASNRTYSFAQSVLLENVDSNGAPNPGTLRVRDLIYNTEGAMALLHELFSLVSMAVIQYQTFGVVNTPRLLPSSFQLNYCDVDLTLYRERGFDLPENIAGGFAIGSTSDSIHFRYQPAGVN